MHTRGYPETQHTQGRYHGTLFSMKVYDAIMQPGKCIFSFLLKLIFCYLSNANFFKLRMNFETFLCFHFFCFFFVYICWTFSPQLNTNFSVLWVFYNTPLIGAIWVKLCSTKRGRGAMPPKMKSLGTDW